MIEIITALLWAMVGATVATLFFSVKFYNKDEGRWEGGELNDKAEEVPIEEECTEEADIEDVFATARSRYFQVFSADSIQNVLEPTEAAVKGAVGEGIVAAKLLDLNKQYYKVINGFLAVGKDKSVQIDHIVVSIYGIFVIEDKNYSGTIYGGEEKTKWYEYCHGKQYPTYNPILQNRGHARYLKKVLKRWNPTIYSIVAFSDNAVLKTKTITPVVNFSNLVNEIKKWRIHCIDGWKVDLIYNKLMEINMAGNQLMEAKHINNITKVKKKNEID